MNATVKAARSRLDKIAIVVGSCLLDGPDPSYADEVELQAACTAYVEAIRADGSNRLALKAKLIELDAGGAIDVADRTEALRRRSSRACPAISNSMTRWTTRRSANCAVTTQR
jgi:hypothetical protein